MTGDTAPAEAMARHLAASCNMALPPHRRRPPMGPRGAAARRLHATFTRAKRFKCYMCAKTCKDVQRCAKKLPRAHSRHGPCSSLLLRGLKHASTRTGVGLT